MHSEQCNTCMRLCLSKSHCLSHFSLTIKSDSRNPPKEAFYAEESVHLKIHLTVLYSLLLQTSIIYETTVLPTMVVFRIINPEITVPKGFKVR